MVAPYNGFVKDGQVYEKGDEVWDLGLWRHNSTKESQYDYTGNENANKLPPYAVSGATAFNPVTGDAYAASTDSSDTTKVIWTKI
jgi:hypothetical protein